MVYTLIVNGRSYDLPKKTVLVMEKIDEVARVDSLGLPVRQRNEIIHNLVKELVGKENAIAIFGSDNLSELDVSDLEITLLKIIDAYRKPVDDYNAEKTRRKLDVLPIDKIVSITNAAKDAEALKK